VAESYHLNIEGEEPALWLARLQVGPPSLIPTWPESPRLAVVVAITSPDEHDHWDYDEVTVCCTRAELARRADWENVRRKLCFTVDRARLLRACPRISTTDFEE
jgi:hypothetical protein